MEGHHGESNRPLRVTNLAFRLDRRLKTVQKTALGF